MEIFIQKGIFNLISGLYLLININYLLEKETLGEYTDQTQDGNLWDVEMSSKIVNFFPHIRIECIRIRWISLIGIKMRRLQIASRS